MSSEREDLARIQQQLARAVAEGADAPPGFDASRIDAARRALSDLAGKRRSRQRSRSSRERGGLSARLCKLVGFGSSRTGSGRGPKAGKAGPTRGRPWWRFGAGRGGRLRGRS